MKKSLLLILLQILGGGFLLAQGDPYSGYTNHQSYFLPYSSGAFIPSDGGDVYVSFSLPESTGTKTNFEVQVDTGSRGFYASSTSLGTGFTNAGSYPGQINLSSSGRVFQGAWTPTTMTFAVTNLVTGLDDTVTSSVTVLVIQSLTCDSNHMSATFSTTTDSGSVLADKIGTTKTINIPFKDHTVTVQRGYSISYSKNTNLAEEENFGVGFYLGGPTNSTTTGPISNNQNQSYNPLINITDTNIVEGYIIKTYGIQLGLATNVSGFAYTRLNPTGFTSDNSVPDWQTPMGTVVNGGTNGGYTNVPGSIVMDSGIGNAYFSAAGLGQPGDRISNDLTIELMNSGGALLGGVGYNIDQRGNSPLNPSSIDISHSGTNGIFSQSQAPYGKSYFNTGRNVFFAFDMLYDAQNGYMGLMTNDLGSSLVDSNIVYFHPQEGGFPVPSPMPSKAQSIKFSNIPSKVFGDMPINLTASATSGLPVVFSSSNTNVAGISNNTLAILGAGTSVISANQSGNLSYKPAPSVNKTFVAGRADQAIQFLPLPSVMFGASSLSLSATSTASEDVIFTSSNKKVATISGDTATIVGAGLTTITASVPISSNYKAATAHQILTVAKADQSIIFSTPPTEGFIKGSTFPLVASAPGGAVTFKSSKPSVISIKGTTATILALGNTTITAMQAGGANYKAAAVGVPVTVNPDIVVP